MTKTRALCGIALLAALAFSGAVAMAQKPTLDPESFLPPPLPWSGASEKLIALANDPWITPSEKTDLTATPDYEETLAFLQRMDAQSKLMRIETFGTTPQGRQMAAVILTKDGAKLQEAKPVFLVQAGIHSGEIDGKDAMLMLIRDMLFKGKDSLLDKVNVVFIPALNADGHQRSTPHSRLRAYVHMSDVQEILASLGELAIAYAVLLIACRGQLAGQIKTLRALMMRSTAAT